MASVPPMPLLAPCVAEGLIPVAVADRAPAPLADGAPVIQLVDLFAADRCVTAAAAVLSPDELARAERGIPQVRRRRILLRAALRELLGRVLHVHPHDVPLTSRWGRPQLDVTAGHGDIDVNCSASGGVGLVAVVRGARVGIDVQQVLDEDLETAWAEGWLAPTERAYVASLPTAERPHALTRAWVQKEAVLKGQGVGLRADLARLVTPLSAGGRLGSWLLSPVGVPDGYVACVAARSELLRAAVPGAPAPASARMAP
jgi:4'-phosphopantetheinyl transferase